MDQYDRTPGGMSTGGTANTPTFGDAAGMRTAPDHQIPDQTSPSHGASIGGAATATSRGTSSGTDTGTGGGGSQGMREQMSGMAGQAEDKLNQGMRQAADRLDTLAQRLDQVADDRLGGTGNRARAGDAAHSVADTMESLAGYLRNNDAQALRSDLERQMRERPLQTLMMAVAAGWLVGKIVR